MFLDKTGSKPATNGFSGVIKFVIDSVAEESCEEEEEEVGSPPRRVPMGQHPGAHTPPTLPSICVPRGKSVTLTSISDDPAPGAALEGVHAASPQQQTTDLQKDFPTCSNLV